MQNYCSYVSYVMNDVTNILFFLLMTVFILNKYYRKIQYTNATILLANL